MTPERFRIVKHLTASLFALAMVSIFVLGIDGVIRGMQTLTQLFAARAPAAAPAEPPSEPGVVRAVIIPADGATSGKPD